MALAVLLALTACDVPFLDTSPEAAARVRAQDLGTLPYHPVAFHLDLSILAYQLYGQTLVWPFDPYYEEAGEDRPAAMARVRAFVEETAAAQQARGGRIEDLRGPGVLGGFEDNPAHDPLLFQYSRLHPWSPTLTYPSEAWTEYLTPDAITSQIAEVFMCVRTSGVPQGDHENGADGAVTLHPLPARRDDASPGARDVLLAFEGGTGDKGEPEQPASQSLAGFALLRATDGDAYDVHIAFRGSRSGSASRAAVEALSTGNARGNPDWITDLGYREETQTVVSAADGHRVSRGMATAIRSSLPQLMHCLDAVVGRSRARAPTNIYLTGHSLGGAQAQMLASAVLLGDRYGPDGDLMPASLRDWPWERLKLVTFGAPRVGNRPWAEGLTVTHLASRFYRDQAAPFDGGAIGLTDPAVLPRLVDPDRPAAYRVLLPSDPITTDLIAGGAHVGHTLYLEEGDALEILLHNDFEAHEPTVTRARITETLRDARIPATAWAYHPMETFNPARVPSAAGSVAEYEKLIAAIRAYYVDRDATFDREAFDALVPAFLARVPEDGP
jgi:hypothetical protein